MKLKTYTAETMAQALAQVRKDLGKDAMILHTRSYRVGSWLGLGGKNMVEITASSPAPASSPRAPRQMPRVQTPAHTPQPARQIEEPAPEIVVRRGKTTTRQRLGASMVEAKPSTSTATQDPSENNRGLNGRDALFGTEEPRAPRSPRKLRTEQRMPPPVEIDRSEPPRTKPESKPKSQEPKATSDENAELRAQLESMQKMMGQVLESTRKTAVAVNTGTSQDALPSGEMPAPLFALYRKLMDNDVPAAMADMLVGAVRDRLDKAELHDEVIVRQALLREIEQTIRTRSESLLNIDHRASTSRPRVIALVGPTGVGKTTTVAKLAATYKLRHHKKVGLITSDTYRIAAVDQLKTYAGIIGLPLRVANSPEEMDAAIKELSHRDIIIVDTAGRSQNTQSRIDELAQFAASANPDETHLVLSTTVGENVMRKTAERFSPLGPDRCILTKLDEAVTTGPIAGLCDRIGLPLSFVTVGQEVPDDLEPARADRLARCVLDGPDAVLRRDEANG
jgi:flagellar biosynthesis protein FlhF